MSVKKVTILLSLILSLSLVFQNLTFGVTPDLTSASEWAIEELTEADDLGFIPERIKDDFKSQITREEFTQILIEVYDKLSASKSIMEDNPFNDTNSPAVIKAYQAGIITGTSPNTFGPDQELSREQACVMLSRLLYKAKVNLEDIDSYRFKEDYKDKEDISSWAYSHVSLMNAIGILNGADLCLNPLVSLTREQAILMAKRTYNEGLKFNTMALIEEETNENLGSQLDYYEPEGFNFNEDKLSSVKSYGLPLPSYYQGTSTLIDSDNAAFSFDQEKTGLDLVESLVHKGFDGVEASYEVDQYMWTTFFDELDYTVFKKLRTVTLKGMSIYEVELIDQYEKYSRYYDENEGIYYEVTDLMMGNYLEEDPVLTPYQSGKSCVYKG